jgi:uncharacterized protein YaaQ
MSPTTRIVVFNFWEYAGFLANTFVFLLIGLSIRLVELLQNWELILWAIGAVLISRAVTVYGLSWVGRDIPQKWKHVLYWGGLRGAISLALALSLPLDLPSRVPIQVMAFGVVLFTLLVQGLSMAPLVRWMNLVVRSEAQEEYERRHARAVAARSAYEHLDRMHRQGLISEHTWKTLSPVLKRHNESLAEAVREVLTADPSVEAKELDTTRREALRAQRSALTGLLNTGVISEDTYGQLVSEVDAALTEQQFGWPELIGSNHLQRLRINRLMVVVVQEQDVESTISALTKLGISITALPSSGAYLGRRNTTLLIGLATGQERAIVRSLQASCRRRVEYVMTPLEAGIPVLTPPMPVDVGGATIFTFEVERFEIF